MEQANDRNVASDWLSDHSVATIAAVSTILAAAFYLVGISYRARLLVSFGLKGGLSADGQEITALGAFSIPAALAVGWIAVKFEILIYNLIMRALRLRRGNWLTIKASGFLTIGAAVGISIPSLVFGGNALASFSAWSIMRDVDGPCFKCFYYETRQGTIRARPILGDKDRVLLATNERRILLLPWSDIRAISFTKKAGLSPRSNSPTAPADASPLKDANLPHGGPHSAAH